MNQEGLEVQTKVTFVWIFLPKRNPNKNSFLSLYHNNTSIARKKYHCGYY